MRDLTGTSRAKRVLNESSGVMSSIEAGRDDQSGGRLIPCINLAGLGYREYTLFIRKAGGTALISIEALAKRLHGIIDIGSIKGLHKRWDAAISFHTLSHADSRVAVRRALAEVGEIRERRLFATTGSCFFRRGAQPFNSCIHFHSLYRPQLRTILFDRHDHLVLHAITSLNFTSFRSLSQAINISELRLERSLRSLENKGVLCGWSRSIPADKPQHRQQLHLQLPAQRGPREMLYHLCLADKRVERLTECIGSWNTEITLKDCANEDSTRFQNELQKRLKGNVSITSIVEITAEYDIIPTLHLKHPGSFNVLEGSPSVDLNRIGGPSVVDYK